MQQNLTELDRDDTAKRYVRSVELWLRRVVHHQLSIAIGPKYLTTGHWRKPLKEWVLGQMAASPGRFTREIDATTFEQLIDITCHINWWEQCFEKPLSKAYPVGRDEALDFLGRLKDIRNDVSHGRGCSQRQLEQVICYSNDLTDSIKEFFRTVNMSRDFDVPMIVKFVDNQGNHSTLEGVPEDLSRRIIDWRKRKFGDLHTGDTLIAEVEIDPGYAADEYSVTWSVFGYEPRPGTVARIPIGLPFVGEQLEISFVVVSNKDWHRQHGMDDRLTVVYRVLPPLAEPPTLEPT